MEELRNCCDLRIRMERVVLGFDIFIDIRRLRVFSIFFFVCFIVFFQIWFLKKNLEYYVRYCYKMVIFL